MTLLQKIGGSMNYFILGFDKTNLLRIERVDPLSLQPIKEVVYGIVDIPCATPVPTMEEALKLKQELINTTDAYWHCEALIDIYGYSDVSDIQIFEVGFIK